MKLVNLVRKGKGRRELGLIREAEVYSLTKRIMSRYGREVRSIEEFISEFGNIGFNYKLVQKNISLDDYDILPPIVYPRRNVICVGKNYRDHVKEIKEHTQLNSNEPTVPVYFTKMVDKMKGHGDVVNITASGSNEVDYEVELAIIMGRDGKDIPKNRVFEYIFGYTVANDLSARDFQREHEQWFKGKSLDGFTIIGPWVTLERDIHVENVRITSTVNGEVRQDALTSDLIFDIPTLISDLSRGMTLKAGDIILTGTPSGVGMGFAPPKYLKPGDKVECYIEGIGRLTNVMI